MTQSPTTAAATKIRASELTGQTWFNTGGKDLTLKDLRGKIVILDFWTFCCVNCLHVLDELRPLEEKYRDVLVTVGVHSPKFDYEGETSAVAAAIERYDVAHPVINDPELITWQAYTARAWPTLVVVDPEGYIVAHLSGEGQVAGLFPLVESLIAEHDAKGTLHRGEGPYVAPEPVAGDLKFPGKAIALGNRGSQPGSFLVSDTGHHRLVELAADLKTVLGTIGGEAEPARGYQDGSAETAQFNEPHGTALLPPEVASQVGYDVVVADTVNHRLRGVNLATGQVLTLAGNGVQRLIDSERTKITEQTQAISDDAEQVTLGAFNTAPTETSLSTPWDVVWSEPDSSVLIAMAGTHQVFSYDPVADVLGIYAGTGMEGLLDGPGNTAWFAQTSGLAADASHRIWLADSETSALRWIDPNPTGTPTVGTAIGTGLFDFGFRDGEPTQARLQHPLGVAPLPDGSVLIADTYNHAIRRYAPETTAADGTPVAAQVNTVARDLNEPSDILVEYDADGNASAIVVVETNAHQLVRLAVPEAYLNVDEGAMSTQRPPTAIRAGQLPVNVAFAPPVGQKLDDRWGDPTQLKISSTPENLLLAGAGTETGLDRQLEINPDVTEGVLHITARAAACDGAEGEEIPLAAACHLYQQDWGIPVTVHRADDAAAEAQEELTLDLRGVHS